ncbi:MAG: hypothetical protein WA958_20705 [Tunicatimonas sp.]
MNKALTKDTGPWLCWHPFIIHHSLFMIRRCSSTKPAPGNKE